MCDFIKKFFQLIKSNSKINGTYYKYEENKNIKKAQRIGSHKASLKS